MADMELGELRPTSPSFFLFVVRRHQMTMKSRCYLLTFCELKKRTIDFCIRPPVMSTIKITKYIKFI